MTNRADELLAELRAEQAAVLDFTETHAGAAPVPGLVRVAYLADRLDQHLSMGGAPPQAWRDGPDAPELDAPAFDYTFGLEDLAAQINLQSDVTAYVEHTGGGVMCLYAAPRQSDGTPRLAAPRDGGSPAWPVIAGGGWLETVDGQRVAKADARDFTVGFNTAETQWEPPIGAGLGEWAPPLDRPSLVDIADAVSERVRYFAASTVSVTPDVVA